MANQVAAVTKIAGVSDYNLHTEHEHKHIKSIAHSLRKNGDEVLTITLESITKSGTGTKVTNKFVEVTIDPVTGVPVGDDV